ncbi:UAA transporter [Meredithblackwellia eburnea MCA 4105]
MAISFSLAIHAAGLLTAYTLYGLLQERIMRGSYGPNHERFTSSALLIIVNRLFSIATALAIIASRKDSGGSPSDLENQTGRTGKWRRLYPASPLFAYAAVALFNFLSTSAQYEALKYVSYTTQSLAKCAKMVPVLLVGSIVHKKAHKPNEWIAGAVLVLGCGTYLFSQPPRTSSHHSSASTGEGTSLEAFLGALCLSAYLFFDGLVSTTQERVFGKNPKVADPFGPDSPVLDQMIWTNIFAILIGLVTSIVGTATGNVTHDLYMLFTTPALVWDVCAFSAASAIGLAVLLNTIASFDALTASLIMTVRQFLSIVLNAGVYGNFSSVGIVGWVGVAWVASGVYIKMKRIELPNPGAGKSPNPNAPPPPQRLSFRHVQQYTVPIALPLVLGVAFTFVYPAQPASEIAL